MNHRICKHAAVLTAVLLVLTALPVSAMQTRKKESEPLSPAIGILAAERTMRKSGVCDETLCFSAADFEKVLGYTPTEITLTSLPKRENGVLRLGTLELESGQILSVQTLDQLQFVPEAGRPCRASFTFTARGRAYETETALTCALAVLPERNEAPCAEDASLSAYTEIPLYAALHAEDPEQDALHYTVVRPPKKGTLSLNAEDGSFVYTPAKGKHGTDVFTFRATDPYGGESRLSKVRVKIRRPDTDVRYDDLTDHWASCAAMHLAENGILIGEQCGGATLFHPEREVLRGDFLCMAMQAAGVSVPEEASATVFADDAEIPGYMKGYVNAAYASGVISGCGTEEMRFLPGEPISRAEAAVMINRLFAVEAAEEVPVFADMDAVPAWSAAAVSALHAAGILSGSGIGGTLDPLGTLDRAQAAQLLSMAMSCTD